MLFVTKNVLAAPMYFARGIAEMGLYRLFILDALTSSVPEETYVAKHRDFLDGASHWPQKSGWDLNFL